MDAREETLGLLNSIWLKLQALPSAHPVELGAFFIIFIFMVLVLLMMLLTCASCCCCCCRHRTRAKQPEA